MDYTVPERRTTRKDLKRKRLFNKYKKGGKYRTRYFDKKETNEYENDKN